MIRTRTRTSRVLVAGLAVVSLGLAACSKDDSGSTDAAATEATADTAAATEAAAETAAATEAPAADTVAATEAPAADTAAAAGGAGGEVLVGLITKTENNPFFVKMKEGADAKATELGMKFQSFAGKTDGDNEGQVAAIESLIAAGAKGILITPSDSKAIVPAIEKARAAGILVIALDTPTEPANAVDATFATDNFEAGLLIGKWAAAQLGDKAADAKIAMLDLAETQPTVDVLRDQGFLEGFGIDTVDKAKIGDETDKRIIGNVITGGNEEGGRTGMENLLQKDGGINVVYTINEPSAAGAYEALKAAGKEKDVLIVSVDGGCPGVANVKSGVIGATSQQYPLLMASLGVEAVKKFAETGEKPAPSPGLDFFNTGVALITDKPATGVTSIDTTEGTAKCWG